MRPVLPVRHDPLIQQFLQFEQGPDRLPLGVAAAALDAGAGVSGHELGEQRGHRAQHPLDVALLPARSLVEGWKLMPRKLQDARKFREMNTFP